MGQSVVVAAAAALIGERLPGRRRRMSGELGILLERKVNPVVRIGQAEFSVDGVEEEALEESDWQGAGHVGIRRGPWAHDLQHGDSDGRGNNSDGNCSRL